LTLSDAILEVRKLINDSDSTNYRYSDVNLVGTGNQVIKRILNIRPDLFATIGSVACVAGEIYQSAPTDSFRIIEVQRILNGPMVTEVERDILSVFNPSWTTYPAGPAIEWMRNPRNPNRFFIFPQAPSSQTLVVEYAKVPATFAIGAALPIPDSYLPVIIDGMVWLAEAIDDEHVNSQRSKGFMESFYQGLGATLQSRSLTDDTESQPDSNAVAAPAPGAKQ
jgi:hypothetical protein